MITSNLTYPIEMGIDAPAELDNHIIFDIYFDETTSFLIYQELEMNLEHGRFC